jgi:hypothetical protein
MRPDHQHKKGHGLGGVEKDRCQTRPDFRQPPKRGRRKGDQAAQTFSVERLEIVLDSRLVHDPVTPLDGVTMDIGASLRANEQNISFMGVKVIILPNEYV